MKQVLSFEKQIVVSERLSEPVVVSLSKYSDCLVIFINQTGAPGSIVVLARCSLKARLLMKQEELEWSSGVRKEMNMKKWFLFMRFEFFLVHRIYNFTRSFYEEC